MTTIDDILERLGVEESCDSRLTLKPWAFDKAMENPSYGPGASLRDNPPETAPQQCMIPSQYRNASRQELKERITAARMQLGSKLLMLGHYYQRDEIVEHADYVGDSFQLAKHATQHPEADHIVFCGVHFMAETADILSSAEQSVTLPNLSAGCSMADMANIAQVEHCWNLLMEACATSTCDDARAEIIPITYMNSSAALKAFCGRHGGIVCTSSNAEAVLQWAFARGKRVLFFPDQHLGRNTGVSLHIALDKMKLWNPMRPMGGLDSESYANAQLILWKGFCSVHQRFSVEQITQARAAYPTVKVIVHPECSMQVVQAADGMGSTAYIVKEIEQAKSGSVIAVGTEISLVNRLAAAHPDKTIFCLDPVVCPCSTMYRIHPAYVAWALENIARGNVVNRIRVDDDTAAYARIALERMLEVHS